jgi:hypothetical protein
MTRIGAAAALLAVLVPAASAGAQGKGPLPRPAWAKGSPPKGWNELPGLAKNVSVTLEQSGSFGELRGRAGAQAFAEPGTGAFYLSWLVADKPAPDKAAALRSALDAVRHSRIAASPDARSTDEVKYSESVNQEIAEATLEWRHVSNETMSLVRAFAWVSPSGAPRLFKGECVVSTTDGKAPPAVEAACREALAALVAEVPAGERGALGELPAGAAAPATSAGDLLPGEPPPAGGPAADAPPPATVGAAPPGDQKVLYTGPPPEPKSDSMSRWFLILGGALLLGGLYLTWRARARSAATPSPTAAAPDPDRDAAPDPDPDPDRDSAPDPDPDPDPGAETGAEIRAEIPADAKTEDSPASEEKKS